MTMNLCDNVDFNNIDEEVNVVLDKNVGYIY